MRNCFLFSGSSGQVNFHTRYVSAQWTNDDKNENKTTRHISVSLTNNTVQDKAMKSCFTFVILWTTLPLEIIKPTKTRLQTIVFHLNHDIQQKSSVFLHNSSVNLVSSVKSKSILSGKWLICVTKRKLGSLNFSRSQNLTVKVQLNLIFAETAAFAYRVVMIVLVCFLNAKWHYDNISHHLYFKRFYCRKYRYVQVWMLMRFKFLMRSITKCPHW